MQILASSSAKRRAVSRPMPPAPPVMTATFSSRRPGISVLLRALRPWLGRALSALRRDVDVLYLRIVIEGVRSELASDAGLLEAAEGCADPDGGVGVYGDHTRLHALATRRARAPFSVQIEPDRP